MKKLILLSLVASIAVSSYAVNNASVPAVNSITTVKPTVVTEKFTIAANSPLTIKLVDEAWQNRENLGNQKIIADYLMTQPEIPANYELAWKVARLVYFIGNYGIGEKQFVSTSAGVKLFKYGVTAGQLAIKLQPSSVEGQFFYAIDLGCWGLAKGKLSAAHSAGDGMDALKAAINIDESYQWYGADRILGRYYQELPGIFGGSNSKALALIKAATIKAPQFSNNWVFLGQYYLSVSDYKNAADACQKALGMSSLDGKYEEMRYMREAKECFEEAKAKI